MGRGGERWREMESDREEGGRQERRDRSREGRTRVGLGPGLRPLDDVPWGRKEESNTGRVKA